MSWLLTVVRISCTKTMKIVFDSFPGHSLDYVFCPLMWPCFHGQHPPPPTATIMLWHAYQSLLNNSRSSETVTLYRVRSPSAALFLTDSTDTVDFLKYLIHITLSGWYPPEPVPDSPQYKYPRPTSPSPTTVAFLVILRILKVHFHEILASCRIHLEPCIVN